MGWYTVVKTINRRRYLYLQTTYRLGGKVKTKNKYIGPVGTEFSWEPRPHERIAEDVQHATIERDILRDHLSEHPARRFLKFRGRTDRQSGGGTSFAELNAQALETGAKGKHLDTMLSESGYASFDDLDESVEEYFNTKQRVGELREHLATLRTEQRYSAHYHRALGTRQTQETVVREIPDPAPAAPVPKPVPKPRVPRPHKPAGGLKISRIRRLKPQHRSILLRRALMREIREEALDNLDYMKDLRKLGIKAPELRARDRLYRFTYQKAFGKTLAVRKK